jgi:hypothetical protein
VRRCLALVAAGVLVLGLAAPAGARSDPETLQINGPGAFALWTTAPLSGDWEENTPYVDTYVFVYDEQNAPPKFGWFKGAMFGQYTWRLVGGEPVFDSDSWADVPSDSVVFRQPLRSASASVKDAPLTKCDADYNCGDDGTVSFDITFKGLGPIDRAPWDPEVIVTPGVSVLLRNTGRLDTFIRAVEVESYTLVGATIPPGSQYVSDPFWRSPVAHASRIFWVHHGSVTVCHDGVVEWGQCVPS